MATELDDHTKDRLSFGPFSLLAAERLLTRDGVPVPLGGRALDILIALISRPNQFVSKQELMSQVWPDVTVEEGSLRFHVASLRKALGDEAGATRYIATLAGRGYSFVAHRSPSGAEQDTESVVPLKIPCSYLPNPLDRMVGREEDVARITTELMGSRFATIVGAGGVGKTTVAIVIAHRLAAAFPGSVLFVDLGSITEPMLVGPTIASLLSLSVLPDQTLPCLIAGLREQRTLIILDTCEHVVEALAPLAASLVEAAPQIHVLATSREALRSPGEHVYRLDALACPPESPGPTAAVVHEYPATQLFMERAAASGAHLSVDQAEASVVADICRRLEGVPLAIELAASRVESYGLQQTAALLQHSLPLVWRGMRTAPPRHRTLHAALDWSYRLLSDAERTVLRRLAVFVGDFALDAALEVVTSASLDRAVVFDALDGLVAKSMVATVPAGAMMRYKLLDTTRAYVLGVVLNDTEANELAVRHATYHRRWLEQTVPEWATLTTGVHSTPHFNALNNVRAALDWSFGPSGDLEIGIGLAVEAAPIFLAMSLLTECHHWSDRAIHALKKRSRGGLQEAHLQTALGVSLMFTRGGQDAARIAFSRSLMIAETQDDPLEQVFVLGPLAMLHLRTGAFKEALNHAKRCSTLARASNDEGAIELARSVLATLRHLSGELEGARLEVEAAMMARSRSQPVTTTIHLGFEGIHLAGAVLARTLWLQGYPVQAIERARETVRCAAAMDHSLTLCIALIWAISVFLWTGHFSTAEKNIDWLISRAKSNSLLPYLTVGRAFLGEVAIACGRTSEGVEMLQESLRTLHAAPYEVLTTSLDLALVQGLSTLGRREEALALIDTIIRRVEAAGDDVYMPELLRVRGGLLLSGPNPDARGAESYFIRSLQLSRAHKSRSWELRTATDLADLWARNGRPDEARALLHPILAHFSEGSQTADVATAKRLIENLQRRRGQQAQDRRANKI